MGRETKIGLAVIGLLLAVFGLVVYLRVYRWQPEAAPAALAQEHQGVSESDQSGHPLDSGPAVQLPTGTDETAPVVVPSPESAFDAGDPRQVVSDDPARGLPDPSEWNAPPRSNRSRDTDVGVGAPVGSRFVDEFQPGAQPSGTDEAATAEPAANHLGVLEVPDGRSEAAVDSPQILEPAAQDPAPFAHSDMPSSGESVAEVPAEGTGDYVSNPSAEVDRTGEPDLSAPTSVIPYGDTVQVAAEEPLAEPPAELERPSNGGPQRFSQAGGGRASVPNPIDEPTSPGHRSAGQSSASPGNFQRPDDSYTVEPNDNYWTISEKLYGTGSFFKALFEHNRQQFPRADRLRYGDVISAPPVDVLERTYPDLCPRPQHRRVEEKVTRAVSGRRVPRSGPIYVVEEGDTLFDIARYTLGQASRWGEIYDLNREVLGDQVDHLKPGMELVLPSSGTQDAIAREPAGPLR